MFLTSFLLELKDLRFHACHGVNGLEQTVGGSFIVNLKMKFVPDTAAIVRDELEGTINYAEAYFVIEEEMKKPSRLIEHVAWRTANALFLHFVRLDAIEVSVEKENPPISADGAVAAVVMKLSREDISVTSNNN